MASPDPTQAAARPGDSAEAVAQALAQLGAWAASVKPEDIPAAALADAALVMADNISVGISCRDEPEVRAARMRALARGGRAESTLFADGHRRVDRLGAAAANAMAMTTAEFDEGYTITPCHAGLYTMPALLAEAEARNLSVLETLRAGVVAYEIITRIGRAWTATQGAYPPLYTHARFAAIGAAAATALAQGLPAETLTEALAIATTLIAAGPRNHLMQGALVRNIWPAAGAMNGMMSAEWAACGVTALASTPYDVFATLAGFKANAGMFTQGLGEDWAIRHGYHRMYACHLFFSGMIESVLEIRERLAPDGISGIESITVELHPEAFNLPLETPTNSLRARFSVPHVVAVALIEGNADPACFTAAAVARPDIAALRGKVRVVAFDAAQAQGHKWPAAVTVVAANGTQRLQKLEGKGGHGEPHPIADVYAKIDRLTRRVHPAFLTTFRSVIEGERAQQPVADMLTAALAG